MLAQPDFLLERFVNDVLCEPRAAQVSRDGRSAFTQALAAGADPHWLFTEILWPAAECVQQLRHDDLLRLRPFNQANRTLAILAAQLAPRLGASAISNAGRRLFVAAAPGEPSDLGAQLVSVLAEAHGFSVLFAGAQLTREELMFALSRLEPEALLIHGSLEPSRPGVEDWLLHLQRGRLWPDMQVAVVGGIVSARKGRVMADVESRKPIEVLELLSLCPEYRRPKTSAFPLQLNAEVGIQDDTVKQLMSRHFTSRLHVN